MDLADLIAQGEHQQQDFKYEISSASKIAHSLSAFANTDGGRLLIGVKDNGRIAGVQSEEEIYMVQAAGELYCQPPVECRFQRVRAEGRTAVIAYIEPSEERPVRSRMEDGNYRAFVRCADENILASPVRMELWRREQHGHGSLFCLDDASRALFQSVAERGDEGIGINQFLRHNHLSRHVAFETMADFIACGLVEERFVDHRWVYAVNPLSDSPS